jgi:hypothetical protein
VAVLTAATTVGAAEPGYQELMLEGAEAEQPGPTLVETVAP